MDTKTADENNAGHLLIRHQVRNTDAASLIAGLDASEHSTLCVQMECPKPHLERWICLCLQGGSTNPVRQGADQRTSFSPQRRVHALKG